MASPIDSLLTELGFEYNPKDLEKFNKGVNDSIETVKSLTKKVVASTAALFGFTVATTSATDKQGKLSNEIGVSVGMIDALEFATKKAGGEASGLGNSLRQLSSRASEAARGIGSGIEAFGMLGISTTTSNGHIKTADSLLLEVSKKFEGLSKSRQIELAEKLGLSDSILLLQEGEDGIRRLVNEAKSLGVTTKQDTAISAEFQDSLTEVWQVIKDISRSVTRQLAPVFNEMNDQFTAWWKQNRDLVLQNIPAFFEKAAKWLKVLSIAVGVFLGLKLFAILASGVTVVKSLTASLAVLGSTLLAAPVAILAAVTALAGLAQDADVFFKGGNSVFGDLIKKFPEWATEIKAVAHIFNIIYDITAKIFEGWSKIFGLFDTDLDAHLKTLKLISSDLSDAGKGLLDSAVSTLSGITAKDIFDFGPNLLQSGFDYAGSLLGGTSNTSNSKTNIEKLEIHVDGSGDPIAVGKAVRSEFQQASQDVNSAVYQ